MMLMKQLDMSHNVIAGRDTFVMGGRQTITQIIKSMFSNSEVGFAYDPNDLSTLYQDASGTVPVTVVGQPVALMLDKSKGLTLGSELSAYATGFTSLTGITPIGSTLTLAGTELVITAQSGIARRAEIPISGLTVGKFYKIRFRARKGALGSGQHFELFTAFTKVVYATYGVTATTSDYTFILEATATSGLLRAYASNTESIDAQMIVESVSVKEITGNHAYQTTSASRPILRLNATTGAYYLEFDGSDDFLVTNSINFTSTDKVSLFAGVRKLSDAIATILCEFGGDISANTGSFYLAAPVNTSTKGFALNARGSLVGSPAHAANLLAPYSAVLCGQADLRSTILKLRTNAVTNLGTAASLGTGNYNNLPLFIGRRGGSTLPFTGHLYSLIGISRLTTDSETIALEKSIAKNVGVAL